MKKNLLFPGCIQEEYIDYEGNDIVEYLALTSPQACAERCASKGGLYWSYNPNSKNCFVKNSDSGRRYYQRFVSGTRACGLNSRPARAQLSPVGVIVSKEREGFPPHQCIDSSPSSICIALASPAPWLALYLGSKARVDKVEIRNRRHYHGERLRNIEVRVTDSLPPTHITRRSL